MDNKINERLRAARKSAGYTQKKLAELLGISEPTMNNYEVGKRVPLADLLARTAEVLGCDAGWLLTGKGDGVASSGGGSDKSAPSADAAKLLSEFVLVPRYDVEATAGQGAVIHSEQIVDHLAFRADWVHHDLCADPKRLILVSAVGDSMEPTIRSGDLLLVDRSKEKMKADGIYLVNVNDGLMVKRVEQQMDGSWVVRGDNATVSREQKIAADDAYRLRLIGRVVWVGRKL
jgi:phage repressor protein C with HTH and peptisase S24 domain